MSLTMQTSEGSATLSTARGEGAGAPFRAWAAGFFVAPGLAGGAGTTRANAITTRLRFITQSPSRQEATQLYGAAGGMLRHAPARVRPPSRRRAGGRLAALPRPQRHRDPG